MFLGTHVRWNMTLPPAAKISATQLQRVAISPRTLERIRYTIHVPIHDELDEVCVIPDADDGSVSYLRLFDALYEFHVETDFKCLRGKHKMFGGIVVIENRALLNVI